MTLNFLERKVFERVLTDPKFFRNAVRRLAYLKARGDPERVHELALEALNEHIETIRKHSTQFNFPNLKIVLGDRELNPIGTAAGLDKNCDALEPLSHLFGFQETGTIVIPERPGNNKPRVAIDEKNDTIYNAQGFPSKGLKYAKQNLQRYRSSGGNAFILTSICGIPKDPSRLDDAFEDTKILVEELDKLTDGFVWNPFSPNTEALKTLRNPETFEKYAKLIKEKAGSRLALVKMGPYEKEGKNDWLNLVEAWLSYADGIVAVNTYMVPKEQTPLKKWGYQSAGKSGKALVEYRQRAIKDTRKIFPKAAIIATGGISSSQDALDALTYADALECYTPITFSGPGLILEICKGLEGRLNEMGYKTVKEFQNSQRSLF